MGWTGTRFCCIIYSEDFYCVDSVYGSALHGGRCAALLRSAYEFCQWIVLTKYPVSNIKCDVTVLIRNKWKLLQIKFYEQHKKVYFPRQRWNHYFVTALKHKILCHSLEGWTLASFVGDLVQSRENSRKVSDGRIDTKADFSLFTTILPWLHSHLSLSVELYRRPA